MHVYIFILICVIGIVIEMKENNENAQTHSPLKTLFPANIYCLEHVCLILITSIKFNYVCKYSNVLQTTFTMEANIMNPDQNAPLGAV